MQATTEHRAGAWDSEPYARTFARATLREKAYAGAASYAMQNLVDTCEGMDKEALAALMSGALVIEPDSEKWGAKSYSASVKLDVDAGYMDAALRALKASPDAGAALTKARALSNGALKKAQEAFAKSQKTSDPKTIKLLRIEYNEAVKQLWAADFWARAYAYQLTGQPDKAALSIGSAQRLAPETRDIAMPKGLAAIKLAATSTSAAMPAHAGDKGTAALHVERGDALAAGGDYEGAMKEYDQAIAADSSLADAHISRGNALAEMRRYKESIESYTKAIALAPARVSAYVNRGFVWRMKVRDKVKGCADWKRACELGACDNLRQAQEARQCAADK